MIIQYQLDCPESQYHSFWRGALLVLGNIVLHVKDDSKWYFFFALCLRGYSGLSKAYPFARLCFMGLLTMAIAEGRLEARQARAFNEAACEAACDGDAEPYCAYGADTPGLEYDYCGREDC